MQRTRRLSDTMPRKNHISYIYVYTRSFFPITYAYIYIYIYIQRDLNHNKKYLPNDYMVPPLPATTKNIIIPENTNRKRKKKSRIPTFKHKRLKIKAKDCLDKSKLTIEAMEKSVINISGKPLTKHHLYAFYLGRFLCSHSQTSQSYEV